MSRPVFQPSSFLTPSKPFLPPSRYRPETPYVDNLSPLRAYQREDVGWLRERDFCLLAHEMRVGKTAIALSALPENGRTIVICDAGLKIQWRNAIQGVIGDAEQDGGKWQTVGWRRDLRPRIAQAGDSLVPAYGEVVIVNWEALPLPATKSKLVTDNLLDVRVIVDEAHKVKNPNADRTVKVGALVRQVRSAWPLTGTPMPGSPMDLWGMLYACKLHKQAFGTTNTFKNFLEIFEGRKSKKSFGSEYEFFTTDFEPGKKALAKVMRRRTLREVSPEMPDTVYTEIPVEITENAIIGNLEAEWQLLGAKTLPPFALYMAAVAELSRAKIPAMLEVVEEHENAGRPLLVFAAHLDPLRALATRPGWAVISGEGEVEDRTEIERAFQSGELLGLGVSIKAGGTGLALHRAADELFVSLAYTPMDNKQAEARALSLDQPRKVLNVNLLIADHPLDRRLFQILRAKEELVEGVVG